MTTPPANNLKQKRILLGVTGSVAAYKAGDIIRRLQDAGATVTVLMTEGAKKFITPLTLAALSGNPVIDGMFHEAEAWRMPHISLAAECDLILIAPATANVLAKIAHGFADDLLTCTVLTTRKPVVIAPAMNDQMYANSLVQANCKTLEAAGYFLVEPLEGRLACGVTGKGHLAGIDEIIGQIDQVLS